MADAMKTKPITSPINPNEPHRYVGRNGVRVKSIKNDDDWTYPLDVIFKDDYEASLTSLGKYWASSDSEDDYDLLEIVEDEPCQRALFTRSSQQIIRDILDDIMKRMNDDYLRKVHGVDEDKPLTENVGGVPQPIAADEQLQEIAARMAAHVNKNYNPDFAKKGAEIGARLRDKYPDDYRPQEDHSCAICKQEAVEENDDIPKMPITLEEYAKKFIAPSKTVKDAKLKQSVHRLRCMAERLEYDDFYYTDDFEKEAEAILREVSNG